MANKDSKSKKALASQPLAKQLKPYVDPFRVDGSQEFHLKSHKPNEKGGLFPHMTVTDNIGITPRLAGTDPDKISARVDELIDLVRLDRSHRDRLTQDMSGGQRQRVGVARALAANPKIVLMDEPFGALDPLTRDALGDDYKALHRKLGLTTVMITHDMAEAVLLADRIAVMEKGQLRAQGTAEELSRSDDPYVGKLLGTPRRQAERLQKLLPQDTSKGAP